MKDDFNRTRESVQRLYLFCPDIDQWPDSWAGDAKDVIAGSALLMEFKDYLGHLIEKGRAKATVRKHADYLWALGGEIIRETHDAGVDEELSAEIIILMYVSLQGGPYWRHASNENDLVQYDSVCRQLYKYLSQRD
jgi:hypothetical protein